MTASAPPRHATVRRGWAEAALVGTGALLLVLAALPVEIDRVDPTEVAAFRVLNATTVLPFLLVWPFMQLGNVVVVPVTAAVAARLREWRLAARLLLAGGGAYVLAKVVKGIVVRGRPDTLLADVVIRGDAAVGRGFVSGHAAVVVALLAVAWPWLGRRGRIVCAALAAAVCLARVYSGAHLPLDVVGGAGIGLAVAGVVRFALGRPA